jgi:chromosome partitioning protein
MTCCKFASPYGLPTGALCGTQHIGLTCVRCLVYYAAVITICVANQKGGVSKTTTTAALGAALAGSGRRVLMVDLDPQSSLSSSLGIDAAGRSMGEVMGTNTPGRLSMKQVICEIKPGLSLAPADLALSLTEAGLLLRMGREYVLKTALDQVRADFDVCLIDSPPTLSILTTNAIGAAAAIIIPTLPSMIDLRALQIFLSNLEETRAVNPNIEVLGVVVSQFDQRTNSHKQALAAIERAGLPVLGIVSRSVKVQEAQAARQLLTEYDPSGRVMESYSQIVKGLIQWLEQK